MLAKKYRFHRQNQVRRVYREGSSVRTKHLSLKYMKQNKPADTRVAVVVSKKVDKRAVIRNRIRRRIYEIIHNNQEGIATGYDLVLTVHNKTLATAKHKELAAEVMELLKKAKIYN